MLHFILFLKALILQRTSRYSEKIVPALCLVVESDGQLQYSSASYSSFFVYDPSTGETQDYWKKSIPLGVDREYIYDSGKISLSPGAIVIVYSSSLLSMVDKDGNAYGIDRIKNVVIDNSEKSSDILSRVLYEDIKSFIKEMDQIDDMFIYIMKG